MTWLPFAIFPLTELATSLPFTAGAASFAAEAMVMTVQKQIVSRGGVEVEASEVGPRFEI